MLTPVSGHGGSSGSKSMMVARREWLRAAASATLMTNAWSIAQTYPSRRASGRGETPLAAARYAAVERDDRAGQIGAGAGREHQRQADHVVGPADAPQRHELLDLAAALGLIKHERRHFALKRAGRDRVYGDVLGREACGEMALEHVHGGLAGAVAVVVHHGRAQGVDRADVDHPRWVICHGGAAEV